jgi:hypothetical protein
MIHNYKANFNEDGTEAIKSKPAVVVYALSVFGKTPFIARDDDEADYIVDHVKDMGCKSVIMAISVPLNFSGYYFPKPMKRLEASLN